MSTSTLKKRQATCYLLEYLLLAISFFLFSSKISILPWYVPLTTYALLYILILIILQVILFIYIWHIYEKHKYLKSLRKICFLHLMVLLLMFLICILSVEWFNTFSLIISISTVCLIISQHHSYSKNT